MTDRTDDRSQHDSGAGEVEVQSEASAPGEAPAPAGASLADAEARSAPSRPSRTEIVFFMAVLLFTLVAAGWVLKGFVTDIVLGLIFAGICHPFFQSLSRRLGGRRVLAAALVSGLLALSVAVPATFLVVSLSKQAVGAYHASVEMLASDAVRDLLLGPGWLATRLRELAGMLELEYSEQSLRALVGDFSGPTAKFLSGQLNHVLSNVAGTIYHYTMVMVIVFYGLLDGTRLKQRCFALSPLPDEEEQRIVDQFKAVGHALLFGNGVGSVLQGGLGGLSMWACGMPSALFWGTVMSLFAFLPLVGISVVIAPAALYLLVSGKSLVALLFLLFNVVQAVVIENVVKTRLIGDRMRMHSLLIFMSLLGGISAFGLVGLVYGPLALALMLTLVELYEQKYRARIERVSLVE